MDNDNSYELVPGMKINTEYLFLKKVKLIFKRVNKDNGGTRYKCFSKDCPARITMRLNGELEPGKRGHTEHGTHEETNEMCAAKQSVLVSLSYVARRMSAYARCSRKKLLSEWSILQLYSEQSSH